MSYFVDKIGGNLSMLGNLQIQYKERTNKSQISKTRGQEMFDAVMGVFTLVSLIALMLLVAIVM